MKVIFCGIARRSSVVCEGSTSKDERLPSDMVTISDSVVLVENSFYFTISNPVEISCCIPSTVGSNLALLKPET